MDQQIIFLRLEEVLRRMGVRKTKLYDMIKNDGFPKQVNHGHRSVWAEHEVTAYQRQQLDRR
jgi:predicted DNA-binding transcriptional regulator AlpA